MAVTVYKLYHDTCPLLTSCITLDVSSLEVEFCITFTVISVRGMVTRSGATFGGEGGREGNRRC